MNIWTDAMVDIETNGTDPDNNSIIQICAVRFNIDTKEVDSNVFNKCLRPRRRRDWDSDTKVWWSKMQDTYKDIASRMEDPRDTMIRLKDWVGYDQLRFWGKPTTFDFSFIDSYYKDYDIENPFHWRSCRDLNSFIAGLRHSAEQPNVDYIEFEGTAHDAFFDTFHQIKILFEELNRNGHYSIEP